ncbi:hypothetical protein ACEQ8H_008456 [Pleosporales sp. CAS-2024a]
MELAQSAPERPILTFSNLPFLPKEVLHLILSYWIGPEEVDVEATWPIMNSPWDPDLLVTYQCPTDPAAVMLPTDLAKEYWRMRHLSWLTSTKTFTTPYKVYMMHFALARSQDSALPALSHFATAPPPYNTVTIDPLLTQPHPHHKFHGLERIRLEFTAHDFFDMFNLQLPPFNDYNYWGRALEHCKHLTLVFARTYCYAQPWFDIGYADEIWENAKCRYPMCEMGKVVDWILRAAWEGGFLKGMRTVQIEGNVQSWVRTKWEAIFATLAKDGEEVHLEPEDYGMQQGMPWDVLPPLCTCPIGCRTLRWGYDEDYAAAQSWDVEVQW